MSTEPTREIYVSTERLRSITNPELLALMEVPEETEVAEQPTVIERRVSEPPPFGPIARVGFAVAALVLSPFYVADRLHRAWVNR